MIFPKRPAISERSRCGCASAAVQTSGTPASRGALPGYMIRLVCDACFASTGRLHVLDDFVEDLRDLGALALLFVERALEEVIGMRCARR